jgi:hypothetical protein
MKKRYSPTEQAGTVSRWLLGCGHRPSEAAMQVSAMNPKKLRAIHQQILALLESGHLERVLDADKRWIIRTTATIDSTAPGVD